MNLRKNINLGDQSVELLGSSEDPYFQNIEAFASETIPLQTFIMHHISSGLILDVGGNIGLTSIAMSIVSPKSKIIAFEPSPANAIFFSINTMNREQIELVNSGVGSSEGELNFVVSHAGANSHVATSEYQYANHPDFHPISVPIITLDGFITTRSITDRIVLIKIDTEGFEPHALAGAAGIIERDRPLIWMEFNILSLNVAHGYSPMAFARALFDRFEVFRLVDTRLEPVPDPGSLVHDNVLHYGSIEDLILKPRPGVKMPGVEEMTLPRSVFTELSELRRKVFSFGD